MQVFLVITCIVIAGSYLGYQFYKKFFAKVDSCDDCAVNKAHQSISK